MGEYYKNTKPLDEAGPGASVLTIFYLFLFILVVLPITVGAVVIDRIPVQLPPGIQALLPWKWGIVAAVNLLVFFFLFLQVLLGFNLEKQYKANVAQAYKDSKPETKTTDEVAEGKDLQALSTTWWLGLVIVLHLLAIIAALLMYWLERRGPNKPLPYLELRW
jgi:hypothetical protein